jgi:type VI secretion system protein ImpC
MPGQSNSSRVGLELRVGRPARVPKPEPDAPFRILVIGDFSGRENRHVVKPLSGRQPVSIDTDNFDDVLSAMQAELKLPDSAEAGKSVDLSFSKMEDFHPDRLFELVSVFGAARQLRGRLLNPATFEAAARELGGATASGPAASSSSPASPPTEEESESETLQRLLGKGRGPTQPAAPATGGVDVNAFIKNIVAPHVIPDTKPQQAALTAVVDDAIGKQMRGILHHPDLQALESAWRGLDFLVRNLELNESLQAYVLDATREELGQDLAADDLSHTAAYNLFVEQTVGTPGGQPWATVVGNYTFEQTCADADLLARMGAIADRAGAPFIAAAGSNFLDARGVGRTASDADKEAWESLRRLPTAAWLGLALPRFLLRLPYGKNTDAIDRFDFEENPVPPKHDCYLWGNPALGCAWLLGQSFAQSGWEFSPGDNLEMGGLPLHVYKEDGESKMTPCAEVWLSDTDYEGLLGRGLMPFFSIRGRDAVRLARFQSICTPAAVLRGRWP